MPVPVLLPLVYGEDNDGDGSMPVIPSDVKSNCESRLHRRLLPTELDRLVPLAPDLASYGTASDCDMHPQTPPPYRARSIGTPRT